MNNYENKRILFMGDSITALGTGERGWVKYFNEIIKPSFFVNVAVVGATWDDHGAVYDGNPMWGGGNGPDINNVVGNQIEKILRGKDETHANYSKVDDYDSFDYIFIAAGTNSVDTSHEPDNAEAINKQFMKNKDEILPLLEANRNTWAGAVRYAYENLRRLYPNSKIFICSPIQAAENSRSYGKILRDGKMLKAICERISDVVFVNTFECGICGAYECWQKNGRDLIDGLHPNVNGAKKIGEYNARALKLSEI